jgi:hypothetical protein
MGGPGALARVKVREVTGIFASLVKATSAADDLLLAAFDRADIDVVAAEELARQCTGKSPLPAVHLADMPGTPRREFVAPEDTVAITTMCVAITVCLGAMFGALMALGSGGTMVRIVVAVAVAGAAGGGVGGFVARRLSRRWRTATPGGTDGCVLWVRVRTPEREEKALQILRSHGADAVHVHEMEIDKRLEDLPLSSLRPDPWLSNERLGQPS